MATSFKDYLRKLNEEGPPPPPPAGGAAGAPPPGAPPPGPPPGSDPLGGMPPPGGDPLGGGAPGAPPGGTRKAVNVTTVWDAIRDALGGDAEHKPTAGQPPKPQNHNAAKEMKKPRSLSQ
jgi:hypothetical protein